ncbi:MAG: hypothetical protein V4737_16060 [Curtobacterium sp.]
MPGPDEAREYVRGVLAATEAVRQVVATPRTLLSMGGSAWFDAVVEAVEARPGDVDVLLRSGASLTHDDGFYAERTPFGRHPEEGRLEAAIRVWGRVTSAPEHGLVLVAVGKRDISFDEGLPVVREVRPGGTADARPVAPAPGSVTVTRLDDQHCYLRTTAEAPDLAPGDVVVFGISHPCTVFDKWRRVLVLADDDTVLDTIETEFR